MLRQRIIQQINTQGGKISFAEYMQQALYAPQLGYYNSSTTKFGPGGDFVTAPELGSLFANCVAKQCAQIFNLVSERIILEFGAGSGQLACDLFIALSKQGLAPDKYIIIELSASLKARQQQQILERCPEFFPQVEWLSQLPDYKINGVIIANEVLDAMPVSRFLFARNTLQEQFVSCANNNFIEVYADPSPQLQAYFNDYALIDNLRDLNSAYISELNLWLPGWIRSVSNLLQQGLILIFDYGFNRAEYYHPQRTNGTLMCHFRHQAHSDPFYYPGLQDITAHVDFTAIAEAADLGACEVSGYCNLASFLINCGIVGMESRSADRNLELKILSSPAEMGELFKAIGLTKGLDTGLIGFAQYDRLHRL